MAPALVKEEELFLCPFGFSDGDPQPNRLLNEAGERKTQVLSVFFCMGDYRQGALVVGADRPCVTQGKQLELQGRWPVGMWARA